MRKISLFIFICQLVSFLHTHAQSMLPQPERYKLKNGMEIIIMPKGDLPLTSLSFYINTGRKNETPGQQSLAELTANALMAGNTRYNAIQQDDILYELGGGFSSSCNDNFTEISMIFPNEESERAVGLMAACLLSPLFPEEEIQSFTEQMMSYNNPYKNDISELTKIYGDLMVYGSAHPLGRHFYMEQMKKNTAEKIKEFYKFNYTPKNTKLVVCGNPDKEKIKKLLAMHFEKWTAEYGEVNGSAYEILPLNEQERFFVNKNGATQAALRWYKKAPEAATKDMNAFHIANAVFSTALFDQIRSKEGKTYSIYSNFSSAENRGTFDVFTQVRAEIMYETCISFDRVLKDFYTNGITDEQLKRGKMAFKNELLGMESLKDISDFINPWVYRDYNKRKEYITEIDRLDISTVNRTIKKYFTPDAYKLLIAGDKKLIGEQLKQLKNLKDIDPKIIETDN